MENEMIERVARALAGHAFKRAWSADSAFMDKRYPGGLDEYVAKEWEPYTDGARVAVAAIGEPTMEVLNKVGRAALEVATPVLKVHWAAAGSASMNPSLEYFDVNVGRAAVSALIDAALPPAKQPDADGHYTITQRSDAVRTELPIIKGNVWVHPPVDDH